MENRHTISSVVVPGKSKTCRIIRDELKNGFNGLLGKEISLGNPNQSGSLLIGTPRTSGFIKKTNCYGIPQQAGIGRYIIKSANINGRMLLVIAANSDLGLLYETFHLLRLMQTHESIENLDIVSRQKIQQKTDPRSVFHQSPMNG
jgi:alpha-glucuronidase